MHRFKGISAGIAATGLAMAGLMVTTGGTALAGTGVPVTGCSVPGTMFAGGETPTCTAGDSVIKYPTSITIRVDPSFFDAFSPPPPPSATRAALPPPPGPTINATWTLDCSVNGSIVSRSMSNRFSAGHASRTYYMVFSVGSPVPNECMISGLTATSDTALPDPLPPLSFNFGISAIANNFDVGGAIYQNDGKTSDGVVAKICADDTANGNANTRIQSWSCLSDVAQFWLYTAGSQFVHNGVCMTNGNGGEVVLQRCRYSKGRPIPSQRWTKYGPSNQPSKIYNGSDNRCLTAPSPRGGTTLMVMRCTGASNQLWVAPPKAS